MRRCLNWSELSILDWLDEKFPDREADEEADEEEGEPTLPSS